MVGQLQFMRRMPFDKALAQAVQEPGRRPIEQPRLPQAAGHDEELHDLVTAFARPLGIESDDQTADLLGQRLAVALPLLVLQAADLLESFERMVLNAVSRRISSYDLSGMGSPFSALGFVRT